MVDYETGADGQKGIVEELRLVSKTGGKFDYVAGLFYQHVKTDGRGMQWVPGQTYFGGLVGAPGGNAATLGDVNDIGYSNTDFKDAALFGRAHVPSHQPLASYGWYPSLQAEIFHFQLQRISLLRLVLR